MEIRSALPSDYDKVIGVVDAWWGGRHMHAMLPKLFFVHFAETSFVVVEDSQVVGFLCGFLSQSFLDEAYIHFVGVNPQYRGRGVGRMLYNRLFAAVSARGRSLVRCVTSPVNQNSIAFHLRMGFEPEPGDAVVDGVPVHNDYDGTGEARVLFVKRLDYPSSTTGRST